MNDRTKMDIRLKIIEELYESGGAGRLREERPDLADEFQAFESVKAALDARPARRPDAAALDAVLNAAADASAGRAPSTRRRQRDREPQARRALYLRSAGVATAVIAVLMAVMTVWQTNVVELVPVGMQDETHTESATAEKVESGASEESAGPIVVPQSSVADASARDAADEESSRYVDDRHAAAKAEEISIEPAPVSMQTQSSRQDASGTRDFARLDRSLRMTSPAFGPPSSPIAGASRRPSDILPTAMRPMAFASVPAAQPEVPELSWDQSGDVLEVYRQIEMIGDGVDQGWGPAVPLEMLPSTRDSRSTGIMPASEQK